jgi:epoxyqueuosine reductase
MCERRVPTSPEVKAFASKAGFDLCGITTPEIIPHAQERLSEWLASGYHGEMGYMSKNPARRGDPEKSLRGVKSVIMLGVNYYSPDSPTTPAGAGRVAKYARGKDYHRIIEKRTKSMLKLICREFPAIDMRADFKWFVDYGPFLERAYAEKAGLGFIGKNAMLISREYGSWILLSEILTTIELPPDEPYQTRHGRCGTCTRCIDQCPTNAIIAPGVVDATRCISYLTIEKRGEIARRLCLARVEVRRWFFVAPPCRLRDSARCPARSANAAP